MNYISVSHNSVHIKANNLYELEFLAVKYASLHLVVMLI